MGLFACRKMSRPLKSGGVCAGTELVLEAEASGRLIEQHTFLYAMAADLRVVDVSKLLSQYKVSRAVCPLHTIPVTGKHAFRMSTLAGPS